MSLFILGVNSAYHESSACLIHEGRLLAAVEEERFNRIKHGKHSRVDNAHELPWRSIEFCLQQAGIGAEAVTHVGYSFDPDARRRLNRELPDTDRVPAGDFGSPEGEEIFYRSNQEAARQLRERFPRAELHLLEHHLCHAASAYVVSPFEEAAVLTLDGIGEFHSTWLGLGQGGKLERLAAIPYPHSLGFLWERFSELLGFDVYGGPGKIMGYGCITDPRGELSGRDHLATLAEIVRLHPDGSFFVDNEVMRFRTSDFSELEKRFGPRRAAPVDRYEEASIAAALQKITEEVVLNLCRGLHRMASARRPAGAPPLDALCMAGGVALNCVANSRILEETPFRRLWIQPAANDAGTAVGAAAYLHTQVLGLPGRPRMPNAFTGPAFSESEMEAALERAGVTYRRPDDLVSEVARRLEQGQIVAWFQGALEFGPRALGHRSILADPTRFDTRNRLNTQVKMRESFRPFAPSVLAEEVPRFFALPAEAHPADFMLLAADLRDDRHAQMLPAVVQENGTTHRSTARLHRVRIDDDPLYHALLEEMQRLIGIGAVLNTSFNISEPIVATPEQALQTFCRSRMAALAMGPFLVEGAR
jgi:carbamoyltransferase